VTAANAALAIATRFHETYERLAPLFGYETRQETRTFDASTPNGKLMVAVCAAIMEEAEVQLPTVRADDPPMVQRLNDGREIPSTTCHCGHCGNEWFVPALSEEWMPNYCCFCGIKFVMIKTDGEDREYKGAPVQEG
jgi:hypothetical protein